MRIAHSIVRQRIIKAGSKTPQGMTIQDLSKQLKVSRPTVTKYVDELLRSRKLSGRRVGVYRLLYLARRRART